MKPVHVSFRSGRVSAQDEIDNLLARIRNMRWHQTNAEITKQLVSEGYAVETIWLCIKGAEVLDDEPFATKEEE